MVVFGRRSIHASRFADLGADVFVTGDEYPREVRKILGKGGFDRTIEAVGSNIALSHCLEITKPGGRINLYGMPADDEHYSHENESDPRIFRSPVREAEVHDKVLQHIAEGDVDLSDWVSHVFPISMYLESR